MSTMPKGKPPYPPEFRRQLVEMVRAGRTPEELSREFEPSSQAIRNWVRQADRDEGRRDDGLTSSEREELARLRRENRVLREEREILKKAAAWFAEETAGTASTSPGAQAANIGVFGAGTTDGRPEGRPHGTSLNVPGALCRTPDGGGNTKAPALGSRHVERIGRARKWGPTARAADPCNARRCAAVSAPWSRLKTGIRSENLAPLSRRY